MGRPRIRAVIAAWQEADRIGPVVEEALHHLPVLVVDDGSTDATAEVAEAAGAEVIRQPENRGKGEALRRGFREALEGGAQAVVTLDADGQHDPAEIPALLHAWKDDGVDLVVGTRDFRDMPPARRLSNTLGRKVLRWATGRDLPDNQSGYRLHSRRLVEAALEREDEPGFGFEVEVIVTCLERGWSIAWVPVRTIYGEEESAINPVTHVARFLRLAARIRRASRGRPPERRGRR